MPQNISDVHHAIQGVAVSSSVQTTTTTTTTTNNNNNNGSYTLQLFSVRITHVLRKEVIIGKLPRVTYVDLLLLCPERLEMVGHQLRTMIIFFTQPESIYSYGPKYQL